MTMIKIEREWCMPSHNTFSMPPFAKLIKEESVGCRKIIEPFPYQSQVDVLDYLDTIEDESVDMALVDPPYTNRQVSEHYREQGVKVTGWHTSRGHTSKYKREIARRIRPGGKAITWGYNTTGLGKKNGMRIYRIMMCPGGGDHYDILATCERKVQGSL